MLHILYGADSFSLKERLDAIKDSLGNPELLEFSIQRLEGATLTAEHFAGVCQTMPFMVSRRLVIVEGLLSRFEPSQNPSRASQPKEGIRIVTAPASAAGEKTLENSQRNKKEWQAFATIARNIPESTLLILADAELKKPKANPLLAELAPAARVETFNLLSQGLLFEWVQNRAAKYGCKLSTEIINHLIDLVGNNLWVIDSELEKLSLFSSGQTIKISDVDQVVGYSRESNIFQLVDAVLQRRVKRALELLHRLRDAGAEPPYILAMLTREIRRLLLAKLVSAGKMLPPDLARELRLFEENELKIATGKARKYPQATLEELYRSILKTDIAIKTGKNADMEVELLITEICDSAAKPALTAYR